MKVLHLFAGAGGSHLAGELLGWESVGSVEIEPYCQAVLRHHYPNEVIHGDIRTYSGIPLAGMVDGVCGGFPCQDISSAGKGAGITGKRSGLWKEFARIIGEIHPRWAFIENSPLLRSRGMEVVLEDLAALGYDAEWSTYRASDIGAPHRRDRLFILASDAASKRLDGGHWAERQPAKVVDEPWVGEAAIDAAARILGMGYGMANRAHRIRAIGNGWVPLQAAEAFRQLAHRAGIHADSLTHPPHPLIPR